MNFKEIIVTIRESVWFFWSTLFVIIFYAVVLGLRTIDSIDTPYFEYVIVFLDYFITIFFLLEIVIKLLAEKQFLDFFKSGWNIFDLIIVLITIIPFDSTDYAAVARLFRIFRVLRIITIRPQLKHLINVLLSAIPAIFDILLLLFIVFYIYSVLGSFLFVDVDDALWGNFLTSMLTLFKVLTLEGWSEIMDSVLVKHPWAWVYFVSFIIMASFVLFNLFIAVIISKMQKEHDEEEEKKIDLILLKLSSLEVELKLLKRENK